MPVYKITGPDGRKFTVNAPEGASREQAVAKIKQAHYAPKFDRIPTESLERGIAEYGSPVSEGIGGFVEGIGSGMASVGRGVMDFAGDILASRGQQGLSGRVTNNRPSFGQEAEAREAEARRLDAPLMATGRGVAGNIAGQVAATLPAMLVPGGATLAGGTAIGAGIGALQPTIDGDSRLANTALGAGAGAAGNVIGRGVARVISPKASAAGSPARELMDQGVSPTPGQALGGWARRIEEGATSIPVVGDLIRTGEHKAAEQWNKAMANKVLAHIGKAVPKSIKVGRELITYLGDEVSNAYKSVLPKLGAVVDDQFNDDILRLSTMVDDLPDGGRQFKNILQKTLSKRMSPNGGLAGETVQEIDEELGKLARTYVTQGGDAGRLGDALKAVQTSLRDMLTRQNPNSAEYAAARRASAELMRIERAAGMTGAHEGVFSPAQLKSAVRAMDSSSRKRAIARGTGLLQKDADLAQSVLGKNVPDSGTPFRLSLGLIPGFADPGAMAGLLSAGAAYGTNPGRRLLLNAVTRRPELAGPLAGAVRGAAAPAAAASLLGN
jgi:hypothetical protein